MRRSWSEMKPLLMTLINFIEADSTVTVLSHFKRSIQSVTYNMNNFTAPQVAILEPIRDDIQSGCSFTDDDMKQFIAWGNLIRSKAKKQWKDHQDTKTALNSSEFSDASAYDAIAARAIRLY